MEILLPVKAFTQFAISIFVSHGTRQVSANQIDFIRFTFKFRKGSFNTGANSLGCWGGHAPPISLSPQLTNPPAISPYMVALRSKAVFISSRTRAPAPLPGTNPALSHSSGRLAAEGLSLWFRFKTRIASKTAHIYGLLASQLPATILLACPDFIFS